MKWHLTIILVSSTIVAFLWFGYNRGDNETVLADVPVIYYTKGLVEQFNGTPRGPYELYRIRGLNGKPEVVHRGGETYLPAPLSLPRYAFIRPHVPPQFGAGTDFPTFSIGVTTHGEEEVTGLEPMQEYADQPSLAVSTDGRYLAVGRNYCTDKPDEGPCGIDFEVSVYDYETGKKQTFISSQLSGSEEGPRVPFVFFTPKNQLIVDVQSQQERFAQFLYFVDLPDGTPTLLYSNINENSPWEAGPNFVIDRVINDQTALATKYTFNSNEEDGYLEYNFITGNEEIIDTIAVQRSSSSFPITSRGYYFSPAYNGGLQFRNFQLKQTETLLTSGIPKAVTPDGRYIIMKYPYEGYGYNSSRLELWDMSTEKRRVIYDQKFAAQYEDSANIHPGDTVQVGDEIFGFVSLEINGVQAYLNLWE